ncbi:hypothetical protein ACFU1R_24705 [Priestia megaterium]|uniref:hypothetical protein n=1 Tax=Priestia megaterium TaxID=1404 RepID=UPI00366E015B
MTRKITLGFVMSLILATFATVAYAEADTKQAEAGFDDSSLYEASSLSWWWQ